MKRAQGRKYTLANLLERGCGIGQRDGLCLVHTAQYPRRTWIKAMRQGLVAAVTDYYDGGYGVITTLRGMQHVHTVLRRHA